MGTFLGRRQFQYRALRGAQCACGVPVPPRNRVVHSMGFAHASTLRVPVRPGAGRGKALSNIASTAKSGQCTVLTRTMSMPVRSKSDRARTRQDQSRGRERARIRSIKPGDYYSISRLCSYTTEWYGHTEGVRCTDANFVSTVRRSGFLRYWRKAQLCRPTTKWYGHDRGFRWYWHVAKLHTI